MSVRLTTQLSQRLVLTPQLRQRIEMLQMTKLDLNELVTQQMVENPVLEEVPPEETSVTPDFERESFADAPAVAVNGAAEVSADAMMPSAGAMEAGGPMETGAAGSEFDIGMG